MKTLNFIQSALRAVAVAAAALAGFAGCSDDDAEAVFQQHKLADNLLVPSVMEVYEGMTFEMLGSGFETGDVVRFFNSEDVTKVAMPAGAAAVDAAVSEVSETYCRFAVPALQPRDYKLFLIRGNENQYLGATTVRLLHHVDIPDKEGANVKGQVYTDRGGVEGVWISDGEVFTQTDAQGFYWLQSEKYHGYVFMCVPSGYQPEVEGTMPKFWATLSAAKSTIDQRDFKLNEEPNDNFRLLVTTDYHLANRNSDLKQFENFKKDMRAEKAASQVPVYALNLGDFSWDRWWYDSPWALPDCIGVMKDLDITFYSLPGNHDNDPTIAGDYAAEAAWKVNMGPTYYSMNIGKVHFIMLDNIVYLNPGASWQDRSHSIEITRKQLDWMAEDLKHVAKDTPIVVGMHASLYVPGSANGLHGVDTETWVGRGLTVKCPEFMAFFDGFKEVHIVSGHTHHNMTFNLSALGLTANGGAERMIEHNVAAVCGTWWYGQQYAGNNICTDGSPDGYKVFDINGTQMSWYYKGTGLDKSKQFRTYDMNEVTRYWSKDASVAKYVELWPEHKDAYAWAEPNSVLINIFDLDFNNKEGWKITVTENGKKLEPKLMLNIYDPLHRLSYEVPRAAKGQSLTTEAFHTHRTPHTAVVTASSATSTLEITVEDQFGNVSTETMKRPKAFNNKAIN